MPVTYSSTSSDNSKLVPRTNRVQAASVVQSVCRSIVLPNGRHWSADRQVGVGDFTNSAWQMPNIGLIRVPTASPFCLRPTDVPLLAVEFIATPHTEKLCKIQLISSKQSGVDYLASMWVVQGD